MRKTRYGIFPEVKIVAEYLSGAIVFADYLEMKKKELADINYSPYFNVITDLRDVRVDVEDIEGIVGYMDFLKENDSAIGPRKTAVLTNSSNHVVHSEMLKYLTEDLPIDMKTVSTYHAAFEWTNLNYTARVDLCRYMESLRTENSTDDKSPAFLLASD